MSITKYSEIPDTLLVYKDIVFVVNVLSHKWALFILLSLKEPMKFNQLRRHLSISHSVLSQALKELEYLHLINRRVLPEFSPPSVEYSLTDLGHELLNICLEMETFGSELKKQAPPATDRLK